MNYDPAWDMPLTNYRQGGSFPIKALLPSDGPDGGILACLPPINQDWLPLILGCLDQLCNPSSWVAVDDDALNTALEHAQKLKQMIGGRADCMSLGIRFDVGTCQLQQSTDGGATWTEVMGWGDLASCLPPQTDLRITEGCELQASYDGGATWSEVSGWDENFGPCVQALAPIIGLPPNPGDQTPEQLACSIASYIAENVIIGAIGKAVTAIQDDLTLLSFGLSVLDIIPEFVIVTAGVVAFSSIYADVQEGVIGDYEDALSDGTLLVDITCAIYQAIELVGYVTPGNFGAILTNVAGVTYAHPAVISAIVDYLTALGPTGLAQLSQIAGLETGADCSGCTNQWCYEWNGTGIATPPWTFIDGFGHYESAAVKSDYVPATPDTYEIVMQIALGASYHISRWEMDWSATNIANGATRALQASNGGTETYNVNLSTTAGAHFDDAPGDFEADVLQIILADNHGGVTGFDLITRIRVYGDGVNPFGGTNCS